MLESPDKFLRDVLEELVDTGNLLDGVLVKLFTDDLIPTRSLTLAELHIPTFTGYAASSAVVWGAPLTDPDFDAEVIGATTQFTCTADPSEPETVYGYFVVDSGGTTLLWAERFAEPVVIAEEGNAVVVVPRYTFGRPS